MDTSEIIWGSVGSNRCGSGSCIRGKGSDKKERTPEWVFGGLRNGSENGNWGEFKGTAQTQFQSHAD